MTLSTLTRLTKTGKGFIALSLIALVAACGGGGGGGSNDAGVVDKLSIISPDNGAQLNENNIYETDVVLRELTSVPDDQIIFKLNGEDITGFLKGVEGSAKDKYIPMALLQGLLKEGENKLSATTIGSNSATVNFTANIVKPYVYLKENNTDNTKAYSFVRGSDIAEASINSNSLGVTGTVINAFDITDDLGKSVSSDKDSDYQFDVTDVDGDRAYTEFAKPGRVFDFGTAFQVNSGAFAVVQAWLEPKLTQVLNNLDGDVTDPKTAVLNTTNCKNLVLAQIGSGTAKSVFNTKVTTCGMFVNNTTGDFAPSEPGKEPLAHPEANVKIESINVTGLPDGTTNVQISAGASVKFDALIRGYNCNELDCPEVADATLPLNLRKLNVEINAKLKQYDSPEGPVVVLALPEAAFSLSSFEVAERKSVGTCIKPESSSDASELGGCVSGTISNMSAIATGVTEQSGEFEAAAYQLIASRLFCEQLLEDGVVAKCGSGTAPAILAQGEKVLSERVVVEDKVVDLQNKPLAALQALTEPSALNAVEGGENSGLFYRVAQNTTAAQLASGGTSNFKNIFASAFLPAPVDSSIIATSSPSMVIASGSHINLGVSINSINQALVASVFQPGLVETLGYVEGVEETKDFKIPIAELGVGANTINKLDDTVKQFGRVLSCSKGEVYIPDFKTTDNIVFEPGDIKLKTAPFIATRNNKPVMYIVGLEVTGRIVNSNGETVQLFSSPQQDTAIEFNADLTVPLEIGLEEGLPKIGVNSDKVSITFNGEGLYSFIGEKLAAAEVCKGQVWADGALGVPGAIELLSKAEPKTSDIYTLLTGKQGIVQQLVGQVATISPGKYDVVIESAEMFLPETNRLNVMLDSLGLSEKSDYIGASATLCDASLPNCGDDRTPFFTISLCAKANAIGDKKDECVLP